MSSLFLFLALSAFGQSDRTKELEKEVSPFRNKYGPIIRAVYENEIRRVLTTRWLDHQETAIRVSEVLRAQDRAVSARVEVAFNTPGDAATRYPLLVGTESSLGSLNSLSNLVVSDLKTLSSSWSDFCSDSALGPVRRAFEPLARFNVNAVTKTEAANIYIGFQVTLGGNSAVGQVTGGGGWSAILGTVGTAACASFPATAPIAPVCGVIGSLLGIIADELFSNLHEDTKKQVDLVNEWLAIQTKAIQTLSSNAATIAKEVCTELETRADQAGAAKLFRELTSEAERTEAWANEWLLKAEAQGRGLEANLAERDRKNFAAQTSTQEIDLRAFDRLILTLDESDTKDFIQREVHPIQGQLVVMSPRVDQETKNRIWSVLIAGGARYGTLKDGRINLWTLEEKKLRKTIEAAQ